VLSDGGGVLVKPGFGALSALLEKEFKERRIVVAFARRGQLLEFV
jgi:hypothetical protein